MTGLAWGSAKSRSSSLGCHRRTHPPPPVQHHIIWLHVRGHNSYHQASYIRLNSTSVWSLYKKTNQVCDNPSSLYETVNVVPNRKGTMKASVLYLPIIFPHFPHFITFHKYFPSRPFSHISTFLWRPSQYLASLFASYPRDKASVVNRKVYQEMEERKLEPNKTFRGWSANMVLVKNIHPEFLNAHIYNTCLKVLQRFIISF